MPCRKNTTPSGEGSFRCSAFRRAPVTSIQVSCTSLSRRKACAAGSTTGRKSSRSCVAHSVASTSTYTATEDSATRRNHLDMGMDLTTRRLRRWMPGRCRIRRAAQAPTRAPSAIGHSGLAFVRSMITTVTGTSARMARSPRAGSVSTHPVATSRPIVSGAIPVVKARTARDSARCAPQRVAARASVVEGSRLPVIVASTPARPPTL